MYTSTLSLAVLAALAGVVKGSPVITSPIATSNWTAGKQEQVKWDDNGKDPLDKDLGMVEIDLYTGSQFQQTYLATLNTVNASEGVANVQIPANVGPSGNFYFIRIHDAKQTANRTDDAFSAIFSLAGGTGKFNSSVSSEIAAASSSAAAASSASKAASTSGSGSLTNTGSSGQPAPTSTDSSGAAAVRAGAGLAAGAVAAVALLL